MNELHFFSIECEDLKPNWGWIAYWMDYAEVYNKHGNYIKTHTQVHKNTHKQHIYIYIILDSDYITLTM